MQKHSPFGINKNGCWSGRSSHVRLRMVPFSRFCSCYIRRCFDKCINSTIIFHVYRWQLNSQNDLEKFIPSLCDHPVNTTWGRHSKLHCIASQEPWKCTHKHLVDFVSRKDDFLFSEAAERYHRIKQNKTDLLGDIHYWNRIPDGSTMRHIYPNQAVLEKDALK